MRRAALLLPLLLAIGCAKRPPADSGEPTPAPAADPAEGEGAGLDPKWPTLTLNGELTSVRWSDGDSFKFKSGPYEGKGVRLMGYNTLESYGPVHRWGDWTAVELYRIAKSSWRLGAERSWTCTTTGDTDHYGRVLVNCPDAAAYIVGEGHAVVFALDAEPTPELLRAQKLAMKQGKGIWAKGRPESVVTSLHSADEGEEKAETYNRVVSTETGLSLEMKHKSSYGICEEVCLNGETGSCMVYVPFEQRYRNKPDCLIVKEKGAPPEPASDDEGAPQGE